MSAASPVKSTSIRTILLAVLFVLGGWGVIASVHRMDESLQHYRQSKHLAEWSRIAVDLLTAAQHLAYERGRSAVVLRAADPITPENRRFIDERRGLADAALGEALENLQNLPEVGHEEVSRQWAQLKALRGLVDRDAPLARSARDAQLAQRWFESASELIRSIQQASEGLMGFFPPSDNSTRLTLLAAAALELRITAGIESSYIAQALSAGNAPNQARMREIYTLRGREDQLWHEVSQLAGYAEIEELEERAAEVKRHHLEIFRPLQDRVLDELTDSAQSPTIPLQQLTSASLPILDGIAGLMGRTTVDALRIADEGMVIAWRHLIQHIIWSLTILLLALLSLKYLLAWVIRPLERVDAELRRLGALPPAVCEGNELDRVMASAEALEQSLAARTEAEAQLKIANDTLEEQVRQRTAALRASGQKYQALIESANDAVFLHEIDDQGMPGPFLEVNELACTQLGYSREELTRMSPLDLDDPAYRERIPEAMEQLLKEGHAVFETAQLTKDGRSLPVEVSTRVVDLDGQRLLFSLVRDITERKWSEAALLRLNRELRAISKCNQALIRTEDEQALLDEICLIICEDAGYRLAWVGYADQDAEKTLRPIAWAGYDNGYIANARLSWSETSEYGRGPAGMAVRSGEPFYVQDFTIDSHMAPWREAALQRGYRSGIALPLKNDVGGTFGVLMIYSEQPNAMTKEEVRLLDELAGDLAYGIVSLRNRVERKRAEQQLSLLNFALSKVRDEAFLIDEQGQFLYVNDEACRALNYSHEDLLVMKVADVDPQVSLEHWPATWRDIKEAGSRAFESTHSGRDHHAYPVEISASYFDYYGEGYILALARDITERKQSEHELLRINRLLRTLSRCNETLVHAENEQGLLQAMCRVVVEVGDFAFAWIGYVSDHVLNLLTSAGEGAGDYLKEIARIDVEAEEEVCRPAVRAIREGKIQVVQETNRDSCQSWRERAMAYGYLSAISLPLRAGEEVIGAFSIYSAEVSGFGEEEVALLSELANDLSYGIHALRARIERERFVTQLQGSMESTIQALASTVELRDPYTAGHQRRVSRLAAALCREAGFTEERVQIVYLAGLVHDIGKISVPAEILSRPGGLSKAEMALVRTHVEAGYEILKDIEFPWPIARIVLQHHERLDGSGYPNGLKGNEILMEARILSICDMVEAMLTHRPYRPALDLDTALAELQEGRGITLDAGIVDLCTKLLREQGSVFE